MRIGAISYVMPLEILARGSGSWLVQNQEASKAVAEGEMRQAVGGMAQSAMNPTGAGATDFMNSDWKPSVEWHKQGAKLYGGTPPAEMYKGMTFDGYA